MNLQWYLEYLCQKLLQNRALLCGNEVFVPAFDIHSTPQTHHQRGDGKYVGLHVP